MRIALIASFAANIVLAVASLAVLPDRVAIHFGPGGAPDNWASAHVHTLLFIILHTFLFVSLYASPYLVSLCPKRWINLPRKTYWLAPENVPRMRAKLSFYMYQFGVVLFVFLFVIGLLALEANLADPVRLSEGPFFVALGLFFAYTAVWCVALLLSLSKGRRVPRGAGCGVNPPRRGR